MLVLKNESLLSHVGNRLPFVDIDISKFLSNDGLCLTGIKTSPSS